VQAYAKAQSTQSATYANHASQQFNNIDANCMAMVARTHAGTASVQLAACRTHWQTDADLMQDACAIARHADEIQ